MAFYVLDENNNKVEAFDKQGVLNVLNQAIKDGTLANIVSDSAFVSKLKCCVSGVANHVAFVSQAKYNELKAGGMLIANCYYFITDDTTAEDLEEQLNLANESIASLGSRLTIVESKFNGASAKFAEQATTAGVATKANSTDFTNVEPYQMNTNIEDCMYDTANSECPNFSAPQQMWLELESGTIVNFGIVNIPSVVGIETKEILIAQPYVYIINATNELAQYQTKNVLLKISVEGYMRTAGVSILYKRIKISVYDDFENTRLDYISQKLANGTLYFKPIR